MMSKKKWFVVFCILIAYILLGAEVFHLIESKEEDDRVDQDIKEKFLVVDFLDELFDNTTKPKPRRSEFVKSLEDYCGKPFDRAPDGRHLWDYYHSVFFVITVVTTIGYGNLAPTVTFTRLFMIFYALIGVPLNGIVMVTLGYFFGQSFTKLYKRWKSSKVHYDTTKLGLIGQIILYLIPGFTFFIFLPAAIMVLVEDWPYDLAVYYCFVTLTTIGFGDYVAGVNNANNLKPPTYWTYKVFLIIWIMVGLGYVLMILGFITRALQSKKMKQIEQVITQNIKKTPLRIRQELRGILQEFLFMKVKRAYKGEFNYIPATLERSQSCPDLNIYRTNSPTTARKRAYSECPHHLVFQPMQSNTELNKDLSFHTSQDFIQQSDLLMKVVDALSVLEDRNELGNNGAYDGFSDSEILASERFGSKWSLKSQKLATPQPKPQRRRAVSDVRAPQMRNAEAYHDITWYGQDAAANYQTFIDRQRTFSEPTENDKTPQSFLTRIKNKFISSKDDKNLDVENNSRRLSMSTLSDERYLRQTSRGRPSVMSIQEQEAVLEQTSIADFIRALSAITVPETVHQTGGSPKRKLGTAGLTPPKTQSPLRTRRLAIRPNQQTRRTSLMPDSQIVQNERRFSLRPVEENLLVRPVQENLLAPPPYSVRPTEETSRGARKFSRTWNVPSMSFSPVQRQVYKRENKDDS